MIRFLTTFILLFGCFQINAQELSETVDHFKIKKNKVDVVFFDPFLNILEADPEYDSKSDKEKSNVLDNYLHNHTLYEFKTTNKKTGQNTIYRIVGNPEVTNSKMFYKVEVYENKVLSKTIENVNCGGTLFEHMYIFNDPSRKKYVGNGINFYGYFRRVQPYQEIKESMISLIEEEISN